MKPLVPPEVDLRGMPFMPLDVNRVRDSSLAIRATGDEFRAAVLLWCASWNQIPAASLPNDDAELCFFVGLGRDLKAWRRLRERALHGWILCDDGRLYHPVVAEKAMEAWEQREAYQDRRDNEAERVKNFRNEHKRLRDLLRGAGVVLPWNAKMDELRERAHAMGLQRDLQHDLQPPSNAPVTVTGSLPATAKTGTGTGTGIKDQERVIDASADTPAPDQPPPQPTEAGRTCLLLRGLGIPATNPSHAELVALLAAGATPEEIADTARELRDTGRALDGRSFGYVLAVVRNRRADAARHQGTPAIRGSPTDPRSQLPPPGSYKAGATPFDPSIPGSF